ncbi:MAG TPA: hypothetical protein VFM00_10130 [Candidatus Eisenbacteria bacterium]|nr:hypothetical protein [Candidatus Eisenbacteria bacterium]
MAVFPCVPARSAFLLVAILSLAAVPLAFLLRGHKSGDQAGSVAVEA